METSQTLQNVLSFEISELYRSKIEYPSPLQRNTPMTDVGFLRSSSSPKRRSHMLTKVDKGNIKKVPEYSAQQAPGEQLQPLSHVVSELELCVKILVHFPLTRIFRHLHRASH